MHLAHYDLARGCLLPPAGRSRDGPSVRFHRSALVGAESRKYHRRYDESAAGDLSPGDGSSHDRTSHDRTSHDRASHDRTSVDSPRRHGTARNATAAECPRRCWAGGDFEHETGTGDDEGQCVA